MQKSTNILLEGKYDAFIRKHYNVDMSAADIALYLGVTRVSVINRYHQVIKNDRKTKEYVD